MFHLEFNYNCGTSRGAQFTENFYVNTSVLATAIDRADAMAKLLAKLHGSQTILGECRIHNLSRNRAGTIRDYEAVPGVSSSPGTDSDYPTTAIFIRLSNADGTQTSQWLKGLPDDVVKKARKASNATWDPAFDALKAYMTVTTNLICMKVNDSTAGFFPIENITEAGVCTATGHPWNTNDEIIITGRFKESKPWRKHWDVIRIDNNTYKLAGAPTIPGFVFVGKATATLVKPLAVNINDVAVVRATSHKVHVEKK